MQLGVNQLIDVRWTDTIHSEWIDNLVASGKAKLERLARTRDIMKRVLLNATVSIGTFGTAAREPDGFLCEVYDEDPEAAMASVEAACENLSISAPTMLDFVAFLERQRLPNFAQRLRTGMNWKKVRPHGNWR